MVEALPPFFHFSKGFVASDRNILSYMARKRDQNAHKPEKLLQELAGKCEAEQHSGVRHGAWRVCQAITWPPNKTRLTCSGLLNRPHSSSPNKNPKRKFLFKEKDCKNEGERKKKEKEWWHKSRMGSLALDLFCFFFFSSNPPLLFLFSLRSEIWSPHVVDLEHGYRWR